MPEASKCLRVNSMAVSMDCGHKPCRVRPPRNSQRSASLERPTRAWKTAERDTVPDQPVPALASSSSQCSSPMRARGARNSPIPSGLSKKPRRARSRSNASCREWKRRRRRKRKRPKATAVKGTAPWASTIASSGEASPSSDGRSSCPCLMAPRDPSELSPGNATAPALALRLDELLTALGALQVRSCDLSVSAHAERDGVKGAKGVPTRALCCEGGAASRAGSKRSRTACT
mmetsp:Transcript_67453/g.144263  ORF Transcript_67453/g.144263 Transcript_67453/m.144263 type:complete len:232 (-) Transcript_67453:219-914(-)